ncbi:hypothetical protein HYH02_002084 [Chlamydomonas schloesseri]|uniref:BTB domain-containing protein n=1 Tax=Chlamydomonas schloesseri TaxID=2026947 RepID=A0A836BC43_9CHLO|nr:hypothetical protein HYH02_002084 [Chlamydomonas schloesseri]|eukprot:KAG2453878.1 hypothetical protein HYH02_002084 [Chlamydomonas schloesseri]
MASHPGAQACGGSRARRAEELFAKGSRLGARADVRAVTADGKELWLHRVVLEMWSSLFAELCVAAEEAQQAEEREQTGAGPSVPAAGSPAAAAVSIHLSDTAEELLPLLSCLYPTLAAAAATHQDDDAALSGSRLDASTALPLLRLADKYDIPHVIATAAATMTDHVLPRLAAAPTASAAASCLQLSLVGGGADAEEEEAAEAEAAEGVAEWVVSAVEVAARLGLGTLEGTAVELLASKFFEWDLQDQPLLLLRLVHCLPPDTLVGGLLCALRPVPNSTLSAPHHDGKEQHPAAPGISSSSSSGGGGGGSGGGSGSRSRRLQLRSGIRSRSNMGLPLPPPHLQPRGRAVGGAAAEGQAGAGPGNGGVGAGGGPRIVPVLIAAAGPAAAVAAAPPLLGPHHGPHHQAAAAGAVAPLPLPQQQLHEAAAGAALHVPQHHLLLQPPLGPMHPQQHIAVPVAAAPAVAHGGGGGGGGLHVAAGGAEFQPPPFAEVAPGGNAGGGAGGVGIPVGFGAGVGVPVPHQHQQQHHQHPHPHPHPNAGLLHVPHGVQPLPPPPQHQLQQPEPFWGGGYAGGALGPL